MISPIGSTVIDGKERDRKRHRSVIVQDYIAKYIIKGGGLFMITLALAMAGFLLYRGSATFYEYGHSIIEFLFSTAWAPHDTMEAGGKVGAGIFIIGSIITCSLALIMATPLSIGTALFITEISPKIGRKVLQPVVEIFVGIPSVVYGWIGLTILVPLIKVVFHSQTGFSVLAAAIVLAVMIFPTITSISVEAIRSVPKNYRSAAYGLGATRWQVIYQILLPAAKAGLMTAVILGLARAFGEALAVTMVIGKTLAIPSSLLAPTSNLTSTIASDMGGAMEGGEYNMALWSMALLLFIISALFILLIHYISSKQKGVVHD